jgi:hypothetical protein
MQSNHLNRLLLSGILICLVIIIYQNQRSLHLQEVPASPASLSEPAVRMVNNAPDLTPGLAIVPLNPDGSIDVRVKGVDDVIDVNIEEIDTYDKLNVHIKSADNYALQNAGPVKVKE